MARVSGRIMTSVKAREVSGTIVNCKTIAI